jgi:hypothetical protein
MNIHDTWRHDARKDKSFMPKDKIERIRLYKVARSYGHTAIAAKNCIRLWTSNFWDTSFIR